jgi:hypothetical protein
MEAFLLSGAEKDRMIGGNLRGSILKKKQKCVCWVTAIRIHNFSGPQNKKTRR